MIFDEISECDQHLASEGGLADEYKQRQRDSSRRRVGGEVEQGKNKRRAATREGRRTSAGQA